jgi:hypothetical protein
MQRLIYNPNTKEILDLIDPCEGTSTGTPFETFEGSPEEVFNFIDTLGLLEDSFRLPPRPIIKKIHKFDLINRLIDLGCVEEFYALINTLPLTERLKWDAAQNISKDYPFLVENKDLIISTLGITLKQFDDLFL